MNKEGLPVLEMAHTCSSPPQLPGQPFPALEEPSVLLGLEELGWGQIPTFK